MKKRTKPGTVEEYLAGVAPDRRAVLQKLRRTIRKLVPDAEECIRYGMPAFRVHGAVVAGFAATANGGSYYPFSGATLGTFAAEVKRRGGTRGALHFTLEDPLPESLVRRLIRTRMAEIKR